jgi:hypothetical protein
LSRIWSRWMILSVAELLLPDKSRHVVAAPAAVYPPPVVAQPDQGYVDNLGRFETITVLRIDPDDDGAGHAGYPKYLVGKGPHGKIAWQFPHRLLFPGTGENSEAEIRAHYESIDVACLAPESATVVALGRRQYGLRVRDGSVLWRKARPSVPVVSLQPYRAGCFALVIPLNQPGVDHQPRPENHSSLAFIDAQTGGWRWLRRVPVANRLAIADGQLCLFARENQVGKFEPASLFGGAK